MNKEIDREKLKNALLPLVSYTFSHALSRPSKSKEALDDWLNDVNKALKKGGSSFEISQCYTKSGKKRVYKHINLNLKKDNKMQDNHSKACDIDIELTNQNYKLAELEHEKRVIQLAINAKIKHIEKLELDMARLGFDAKTFVPF